MTSDFIDITSSTTVRKCLSYCVDENIIKRVFDGVYQKPKYSDLLKEYLPADPDKVAYALARNYHWNIAPCRDAALNKLSLSSQVPSSYSYVSDGPYREYAFDNIELSFKHRANREISLLSKETTLVIEVLMALGKDNISDAIINHLRKIFSNDEKKTILSEARGSSEWIYEIIKRICD